jgi:hypothetical protein
VPGRLCARTYSGQKLAKLFSGFMLGEIITILALQPL